MARTVIYGRGAPDPGSGAPKPEINQPRFGGPVRPSEKVASHTIPPVDDYKDKLVKFVPAEVVAFFAPLASLVQERPVLLVASGVLGLLATPSYLWLTAEKLDVKLRPPIHNYVLSTVAFGVWALATSRLGTMAGLDPVATAFALGVTVFLIPLIDSLFMRIGRRQE